MQIDNLRTGSDKSPLAEDDNRAPREPYPSFHPAALAEVIDQLRLIANELAADGAATWYLFGSVTRSPGTAKDIDLLVVCDTDQTASLARARLHDVCLRFPLHLMLMTANEEAELGFVESEGCIPAFPDQPPACPQASGENPTSSCAGNSWQAAMFRHH